MPRKKKEAPNRSDGRYEVKITVGHDINGKPIRKSFFSKISKEDARAQADEYKNNTVISNYLGIGFASKEISFEQWANDWLLKYKKGSVKESTYTESYERTVKSYLAPNFGKRSITDIIPADIHQFMTEQSKIYSESTLKKMRICLKAIFDTAIENNLCYKNPANKITISSKIESGRKKTYDQPTANRILSFADTHKYGLYIKILLEQGIRCSELVGLQWGDFDCIRKTISIKRATTAVNHKPYTAAPKSKSSIRTLPIGTKLSKLIQSEKQSPFSYVVERAPITPSNFTKHIYNKFFNDLREAHPDIERLTPHELRHTCGTLLYNKTHDIFAVSKFLGHSNVGITAKLYVHEDVEVLRDSLKIV